MKDTKENVQLPSNKLKDNSGHKTVVTPEPKVFITRKLVHFGRVDTSVGSLNLD